jgi:hypothetical protein
MHAPLVHKEPALNVCCRRHLKVVYLVVKMRGEVRRVLKAPSVHRLVPRELVP